MLSLASLAARRPKSPAGCSVCAAFLALSVGAPAAQAMDGLTPTGQGARQKALAGAGAADSRDATAAMLNPAGLVDVENQISASVSAFRNRGNFDSWGTGGFAAPGHQNADNDWTTPAHVAAAWRVNWGLLDVIGVNVAANEGMRTHYKSVSNASCPPGLSGISCGGAVDFDVVSTTASIALAKKIAPGVSIGLSPFLVRQAQRVNGLSLYSAFSSDPASFSNRGLSEVWGVGVRGGIQWSVTKNVRLGLSGQTRTSMPAHSAYRGLLAEGNDMDIPASVQAGVAWDILPNVTIMGDYKRVWNGSVPALANTSLTASPFGTGSGPGFGWKDVDIFKVAAEWRRSSDTTLRAGYSYSSQLNADKEADVSIFVPSFVQHHISAGLNRRLSRSLDFELSAMYGLPATLTGPELGNPARTIKAEASQVELTAGIVYRFGGEETKAVFPPLK